MRGMPADDFPALPLVENGTALKLDPAALVKALRSTLFASSSDEAKQLLTGVHLRFDRTSLEAASTDGHRLAVLSVDDALEAPLEVADPDGPEDVALAVTLPARSLREVERLMAGWKGMDAVSLFCERGQVVVLAADQMVTSRTLEGTYPNYRQLIPESFNRTLQLDRRAFVASLERIAVLADQHNNVVRIGSDPAKGLVQISADAQDVGSGSESLPADIEGEPVQIAFNVRYVLDGLKAMDADRVCLQCNAPTTPAILSPADDGSGLTYLVMPVQIRT